MYNNLTDEQFMLIQASTLYVLNEEKRIVRVNEPGETDSPVIFIGKTRNSVHTYVSMLAPEQLVEELKDEISSSINMVRLCNMIGKYNVVNNVWIGPAYAYIKDIPPHIPDSGVITIREDNAHMLSRHFESFAQEITERQPMTGYVVEGQVVSLCCSARSSDQAAEASITTAENFRGRGLAEKVVAKWIGEVLRAGKIPLYSTSWDNLSSQRVAQKLGLHPYGVDFNITVDSKVQNKNIGNSL